MTARFFALTFMRNLKKKLLGDSFIYIKGPDSVCKKVVCQNALTVQINRTDIFVFYDINDQLID